MNAALRLLLDGQGTEFRSTSRLSSGSQQTLRSARRASSDFVKAPLFRASNKNRTRRSFSVRSAFDDTTGLSSEVSTEFREEMIEFARTAPTMSDPESLHNNIAAEARKAMKFLVQRMLGTLSHQFFDIRYQSITKQCRQLCMSIIITGYLIKNGQDRFDLLRKYEAHKEPHARTHNVKGDVILWVDNEPRSVPAAEYIRQLEMGLQHQRKREQERFDNGDCNELVEFIQSLEEPRLAELANGACEEVLLAIHVCCDEFLGKGDERKGPMMSTLPKKEMCRLAEWLMTFGYNLRIREQRYEMERAFSDEAASP